ncbi:glucans biosynthesis glucosyltransferase MdoH [Phenylobacterium immobile]|uniref:glucans biosynthesis glucosyltransferase MdoH n=1 Tax=Phenylobacterium immobile TaxID=21 RepID=UPI000A8291EB|nr:glucans biosynthesis glucosyltransferase MdoH [Phenylobacterium immobile]
MQRAAASAPALQILPERAPLDMPVQSLSQDHVRGARRRLAATRAGRRSVILGATALATAGAVWAMGAIVAGGGFSIAEIAMLVLFAILFAWIAFAMTSALAGFCLAWAARDLEPWRPQPILFSRTALLLPTYNEDPGRILAGVRAIREELDTRGVAELFDIFVLSDTRLQAVARAEVAGVMRLRNILPDGGGVYYRRRPLNLDRKAGNIADWVRSFGAAYESMIVLDADSLMSGDTIMRLTAAMEADPKAGLIQTVPAIIGAQTLFGRLQQFACRIYGPVIAQGQAWWSGDEGNYWGHNAIIRTRAFAACAGLPHIEGSHALSGHIMSHDFVEAALLRRGGWAVRMAPALAGSYEETPPSLIDMAVRDRRWCQGNLQHSAVIPAAGLHWVSRLHLFRGVLAYATAPLWLAFLILGVVVWAQQTPTDAREASPFALFGLTMALLIAPKIMGLALVLRNRLWRRACGGTLRLATGVIAEILVSALMAPVFMLMQTRAVFDVLAGRRSGWATQQRDGGELRLRAAWRRHRWHTLAGVAWASLAWRIDPMLFAWTGPVALGLLLSAPLSLLTSRLDLGAAARKARLFLTIEEADPPTVIARAAGLRADYDVEAPVRLALDRMFRETAPFYTGASLRPRLARMTVPV